MKNLIDAKTLAKNIDKYTIIDCRGDLDIKDYGHKVYEEGHLPGAQMMNVEWMFKPACKHGGFCPLPDINEFAKNVQKLGVQKDKPVVVYGDNNQISYVSRLWWLLKYIGIKNVSLLVGGMENWKKLNLPITKEKTKNEEKDLVVELQKDMLATIDDVKEIINNDSAILVDARPPFKYNGTKDEPLAGHLPGAVNIFFGSLFDKDGQLDEEKIKTAVAKIKELGKPTVAYCNSGVAAQYLTNLLCDYGITPSVYVGSLSDWMSYEGNVLEKGAK